MEQLIKDLLPIEVPSKERTSFVAELLSGLGRAVAAKETHGHYDVAEACKQLRKLVR